MTEKMWHRRNHEIDGIPNVWDKIEHPKRHNKFHLCGKKSPGNVRCACVVVLCAMYPVPAAAIPSNMRCTVQCNKTKPLKNLYEPHTCIYIGFGESRALLQCRVVSSRTVCAVHTMEKWNKIIKWRNASKCAPSIRIGTENVVCCGGHTATPTKTTQDDFSKCVTKKKNTRKFVFHSNRNKDRKFFISGLVVVVVVVVVAVAVAVDDVASLRSKSLETRVYTVVHVISSEWVCKLKCICACYRLYFCRLREGCSFCRRMVLFSPRRHSEAIFNGVALINSQTSGSFFLVHSIGRCLIQFTVANETATAR